jgi:hypothetical protein
LKRAQQKEGPSGTSLALPTALLLGSGGTRSETHFLVGWLLSAFKKDKGSKIFYVPAELKGKEHSDAKAGLSQTGYWEYPGRSLGKSVILGGLLNS